MGISAHSVSLCVGRTPAGALFSLPPKWEAQVSPS